MSNLLIAIGGTGQHVALAFSRLVKLGIIQGDWKCFTIDGDVDSNLAKKLKTFGKNAEDAASHPLSGASDICPPFNMVVGKTTVVDLFIKPNGDEGEKAVFEALFCEADEGIDLEKGMYGKPSIGSLAFLKGINEDLRKLEAEIKNVDAVVLTGSFAGGTGAGITHQLVTKLAEEWAIRKGLYGVFLLPWMKLPVATTGTSTDVDDLTLDINMRHGLEYFFSKTAKQMNKSVLLGPPNAPGVPEWMNPMRVTGGDAQDEMPHFLHLVAAYCIQQLPLETSQQNKGQIATFGADDSSPGKVADLNWASIIEESFKDKLNASKYTMRLLEYLTSDKIKSEIKSAFSLLGGFNISIPDELYRSLKIGLKSKEMTRDSYINAVIDCWKQSHSQYEFSIEWVRNVLGSFPESPRLGGAESNPMDEIRRCWNGETVNPDDCRTPEKLASTFEKLIFDGWSKK